MPARGPAWRRWGGLGAAGFDRLNPNGFGGERHSRPVRPRLLEGRLLGAPQTYRLSKNTACSARKFAAAALVSVSPDRNQAPSTFTPRAFR